MSAEFLFFVSLAVKMGVTAAFLVTATFIAERAGPLVGGMIATLPISAGPAYVFLALDHGPEFIASAGLASVAINTANCIYALVYALLAQRHGLALSMIPALAIWFVFAGLVRTATWTTSSAILFNVIVFGACLPIGNRLRHAHMPLAVRRWYDMPLRTVLVATLVAVVVGISERAGPFNTGTLAVFPVVLSSLMLILHPRMGGPASAAVLANTMLGLVGFSAACLCVHLAVVPLGTAAGLALALAVSIVCNFAFWSIRRSSRPLTS